MHKFTDYLLVCLFCAITSQGVAVSESPSYVAIIIDDLGDNLATGVTAVYLPGQVTLSVLPFKHYSRQLAHLSHTETKEVMLYLPMQAMDSRQHMGPGGLTAQMSRQTLIQTFHDSLASVPYVRGINNHMGSLLTSLAVPMYWLMQEIRQMGNLYFVDSRTHRSTIAAMVASRNQLPHTHRDIFLDHWVDSAKIRQQFKKLVRRAQKTGFALAIGHPHVETLQVLNDWLPKLEQFGIKLVSVSNYIRLQQKRENLWHASLYLSPRGVKN